MCSLLEHHQTLWMIVFYSGRENEIELIDNELRRLVSGHECPDHYIISGASGIGKTRLQDHFIRLAETKNVK